MSAFLGQPVLHLFGAVYSPHVRHGRAAGHPERPAQPAAYRRHGQCADDRPGPDVDDVDLRRLGLGEHRRRDRQDADLAVHRLQRRRAAVLDRRRRGGTPPRRRRGRHRAAQRLPGAQGRRQRLDGRRSTRRRSGSPSPIPTVRGSFADLGPGTVAISEPAAKRKGFKLGDTVTMKFQARRRQAQGGRAVPAAPRPCRATTSSPRTPWRRAGSTPLDAMVFVTKDPGASTDAVRKRDRGRRQGPADGDRQGPRGLRRGAEAAGQPVPLLHLRPARPRGDHRDPGRDQHAQPLGDRADPRGRAAPRRRRHPPAAAHDDPAGVGRGRGARWRARHRAGRRCSGRRWCPR